MKRSPRSLNARQLEAFRAVMVSGSITRAGRLMSISQPAVTRLIHDLEIDLDMSLFSREGGTVTPTAEAREFHIEVERYFISTDRLRDAAVQIRENGAARLRIASIPAFSPAVLPNAIQSYSAEFPNMLISVHSGASVDIIDLVASGQVDLGFIARPPGRNDLEFQPLPAAEVVCLLPRDHPLASRSVIYPQDLHGQDYIALGPSSLMRMELHALLREADSHPHMRIESLFSGTAAQYVDRGLGLAVLDPLAAATVDTDRTIVRRFEPRINYDLSVVFAPRVVKSRKIERMIDHLTAAYVGITSQIEAMLNSTNS